MSETIWNRLIILSVAVLLLAATAAAGDNRELPIDPQLRLGRLDNGMTYYIRQNGNPQGRAEFWLVQNTGSLVEEEDERGLAHFIEHMAFHGTQGFPNYQIINLLQNAGVSYGRDINATTGFDDTRFQISNVPTERKELLDTVLLIIKDLSCGLAFDEAAIEEESRVIEEEWRSHADHTMRLYESTLPILMSGSRYASRIPIGMMSVIRHATRQQLLDFYRRWYNPEHQAVVIVGDFDADQMERNVKKTLGCIPRNGHADIDPHLGDIPDHLGVTYALNTDPEASSTIVRLMFEYAAKPINQRNTLSYLRLTGVSTLIEEMLNMRLDEASRQQSSPISYGIAQDQGFLMAHTRDALALTAMTGNGRSGEALDTLITHAARAIQHGFTASELERAKRNTISVYTDLQTEADKHASRDYVDEYIRHYIEGGYIPGVVAESQMMIEQIQSITMLEVNDYLSQIIGKDNVSVLISGPQTMGGVSRYPTSRDVISHFNRIMDTPQSPYIDITADDTLLDTEPVEGSIINETFDPATGITTMTLKNGATVRLKPTTFKNNEVLFNAFSSGGRWAYGDTADINVRLMSQVIESSALGGHTVNQLYRALSGRRLGLTFDLNDPNEQLNGACLTADLECLLQLCYLYFTDVRADKEAFSSLKTNIRSQLSQAANNPQMIYSDSISSTIYHGNPMYRNIRPEQVDQLDYERVLELYRQRVSNAGDFTFSLVGAFDIDEVRPLIKKYLASLPDNGVREPRVSYLPAMQTGMVDNFFEVPMRNPKTSVYVTIMGDKAYSFDDEFMIDLTGEAVGAALLQVLRHKKHGTYDVASDASLSIYQHRWMINYEYETNCENRDSMLVYAEYAVNNIFNYGVSDELFHKMKENIQHEHESALQTNGYWMRALQMQALGIDIVSGFDHIFPSMTIERLNGYIKTLRPHTRLRVVMN